MKHGLAVDQFESGGVSSDGVSVPPLSLFRSGRIMIWQHTGTAAIDAEGEVVVVKLSILAAV